jgi:hypothetical protein
MVDRHRYIPRVVKMKLKKMKLWKFRPIKTINYNNPKWPLHQRILLRFFNRQCRTERISLFRWFPHRLRLHLHYLRLDLSPKPNQNPHPQERAPSYDVPPNRVNGSFYPIEWRPQA